MMRFFFNGIEKCVAIYYARVWCIRGPLLVIIACGFVVRSCLAVCWAYNFAINSLWGRVCSVYLAGNDFSFV